jgi:ethanolamine utilization protein EutJ
MTLVLAGSYRWSTEEAERIKRDPTEEHRVYPVVKPVVEKMAAIVGRYLEDYPVDTVYVVGGACCFSQFEQTFEKCLGVPVVKPAVPLLVTPLGIAVNCKL